MFCSPMALKLTLFVPFLGFWHTFATAEEATRPDCFLKQYNPPALSSELDNEESEDFISTIRQAIDIDEGDAEWLSLFSELEAALKPMFVAIPTNRYSNFGPVAVRYALHRLFLQRYGWSVKGLEPDSNGWNSTSPTLMLQGLVDVRVQEAFEKRLSSRGFTLQETTLLAVVFKLMTHQETRARLMTVFQATSISPFGTFDEEKISTVLELYMTSYILSLDLKTTPMEEVTSQVADIDYIYPVWNETKEFMRQKALKQAAGRTKLALVDVEKIVQDIEDNFGQVQNLECQLLKGKLIALQDGRSGRVPVSKFYRAALHQEQWQFSESTSYLRQLGALDDTEPDHLRVILANWITSRSNCVASSKSYSVCCYNECEALLGSLEQSLQAPDGTPSEIAALVVALPSPSAPADRRLPDTLLQRLEQIAEGSNGRVRLHGRLFAQWMHHVYPLECAFPHLSGTTVPLSPVDYVNEAEQTYAATEEEMLQFIATAENSFAKRAHSASVFKGAQEVGECTEWQHEEEYFVPWSVEMPSTLPSAQPWTLVEICAAAATFFVIVSIAFIIFTDDFSHTASSRTYSV